MKSSRGRVTSHISAPTQAAALVFAVSAVSIAAPSVAIAEGADHQVGEVVVTAQKREQRLQDVPVSVTAIGGDELKANRITSVADLNAVAPNLSVRTEVGGASLPRFTMRGLVSLGSVPGSDRGIAMYIDGIYIGNAGGSIFDLPDIQRIEVLRGPQGTLFGRNSTGGAISIVTAEPTGEFGVKQDLTVGNYDQFRSSTSIQLPAVGPLSALINYTHTERRGDILNLGSGARWDFTGSNGGDTTFFTSPRWLGSQNSDSVSAAIKFDPSTNFTALVRADYSKGVAVQNGLGTLYLQPIVRALLPGQPDGERLGPISNVRPKAVNNFDAVPTRLKNWGASLKLEYRASERVSVKSITAYRKTNIDAPMTNITSVGGLRVTSNPIFAALLGPATAISAAGAPFLLLDISSEINYTQWSSELQVNYDAKWATVTTGAMYFEQAATNARWGSDDGAGRVVNGAFRVFPGGRVPYSGNPSGFGAKNTTFKVRSYAAYAHAEIHLTEKADFVAGARYTKDFKKAYDLTAYNATSPLVFLIDYEDSQLTYNLGVNYRVSRHAMAYAKYSTGYISGGAIAGLEYAPETAKSWEAGVKADWLSGKLRTNIAAFSVLYGDLQFSQPGTSLVPPRPGISQLMINAGDARAKGFEVEVVAQPLRVLNLSAGVGYTDFRYKSLLPIVTSGNSEYFAQYRPEWTADLSAQYRTQPFSNQLSATVRIDANWRSRQTALGGVPTSLSATEQVAYKAAAEIDAYWIVNGRVALGGFKVGPADAEIAFWARNIFNDKSPAYKLSTVLAIAADYERARTVGVDINVSF